MVRVFLIHGFQSKSYGMKPFIQATSSGIPVSYHNWNSGKYETKIDRFLSFISGWNDYSSKTISAWDQAFENIRESAESLLKKITEQTASSDIVLLVAHSMGAEVVLECLRDMAFIDNPRKVFLFLMAGISETIQYDSDADSEFVIGGLNFYSEKDEVLKVFLEGISGISDPIGLNKIDSDNIKNIKTTLGHNDYLDNDVLIQNYVKTVNLLQEIDHFNQKEETNGMKLNIDMSRF